MTKERISDETKAEALRLRALGLAPAEIGRRLGISRTNARYILGMNKQAHRAHRRAARAADTNAARGIYGAGSGASFIRVHQPRAPARIIASPEIVMAAALAFSSGEITRAELMERIEARG